MPLVVDCLLIDCVDPDAMSAFWCQALDLEHVWTGPSWGHCRFGRIWRSTGTDAVPERKDRQQPSSLRSPSGRPASRNPSTGGTRAADVRGQVTLKLGSNFEGYHTFVPNERARNRWTARLARSSPDPTALAGLRAADGN